MKGMCRQTLTSKFSKITRRHNNARFDYYVGRLMAYRHIVFKVEKFHLKNFAHKQSKICDHCGVGGWGPKTTLGPPPSHPPWNRIFLKWIYAFHEISHIFGSGGWGVGGWVVSKSCLDLPPPWNRNFFSGSTYFMKFPATLVQVHLLDPIPPICQTEDAFAINNKK